MKPVKRTLPAPLGGLPAWRNNKMFTWRRWLTVALLACSMSLLLLSPLQLAGQHEEAIPSPVAAQVVDLSQPLAVHLLSESEGVEAGNSFLIGIDLHLQDGWHTYWKNPGDAGMPVEVEWELPKGFQVRALHWPEPERFEQDGFVGFGYHGRTLLVAEIDPPKKLSDRADLFIGVHIQYVACQDACVPGELHARLPLHVGPSLPSAAAEELRHAYQKMPQPLPPLSVEELEGGFALELSSLPDLQQVTAAYFYPEEEGVLQAVQEQPLERKGEHLFLHLPRNEESTTPLPSELRGILVCEQAGVKMGSYEVAAQFHHPVLGGGEEVTAPSPSLVQQKVSGFIPTLFFAFLGGLLLNLMPCVLPVISLKLMQFVSLAGSSRRKLLRHGFLFTAGVLICYWSLAALLFLLRAAGHGVGWGFQLQEPLFLFGLIAVFFLLGLSLLGVFEIGTSLASAGGRLEGKKEGKWGIFLSGVLATVVATPCTGPFLAPALGFAVTLPFFAALGIFTAMGVGMAFPYLLLSFFPKLINYLPKPGPWMVLFKQIMGFLMMGAVVWLLWVLQAQLFASMALVWVIAALFALAIGGWIYGRWGTLLTKAPRRMVMRLLALLVLAGGLFLGSQGIRHAQGSGLALEGGPSPALEHVASAGEWLPWDAERFSELRRQGVPVFVDFTAKWCLICQANRVPMHADEVVKVARERGIILMEADWTKRDPLITKELERYGRNGVPLYLLYGGSDTSEPEVLPQLLSKTTLLEAFSRVEQGGDHGASN